MKNYVIFNGLNSYVDLKLLLDALSTPILNESVEHIEVNGRNGTLTIRNGCYQDRIIPFRFTLIRNYDEDIESFIERIDRVNDWLELEGSNELITYLRTNKKYIVKFINKDIIEIENSRMINIEGEFICDPFMYEVNESVILLDKASDIYYSGTIEGECNIKIYGSGNIQLTINDETVQINDVDEYVELDSKLLLCINKDNTSKTIDMIGHFPLLTRGSNAISWSGNVSKVEILPRTAYK